MKKILSAWLAAALLLSLLPGTVRGAGSPVIAGETVTARPGETVEVKVTIRDNPGILGATLRLSFPAQLRLLSLTEGEAFSALTMTKPGALTSPCNVVWDGMELNPEDGKDGVILTLRFAVSDQAREGESYEIGLSCQSGDVLDGNMEPVSLTCAPGAVNVASDAVTAKGKRTDTGLSVEVRCSRAYEQAYLFLASYSEAGKLLDSRVRPVSLGEGENTLSFPGAFGENPPRAFLTDGSLRPLCPAILFRPDTASTVTFLDYDGRVLSEQTVAWGENALPPASPARPGYVFTQWEGSYTGVTADQTVTARYQKADSLTLAAGQVWAHPGDGEVVLPISVVHNPGILGMTLTLSYDREALTLTSAVKGEAVPALVMTPPGELTSPCNFMWDGMELAPSDIRDGTILLLTFAVAPGAAEGTYPVTVTYAEGGIIDSGLSPLRPALCPGGITILT